MIRMTLALLLTVPGLSAAQVYKCSGKSGETVYSQSPCTQDARPHVLRNGHLAGSNLRLDRQCLDQARAGIYAAANDRVAALQQQVMLLQQSGNHSPRIASLREQIANENRNASRQASEARADCMREREPEPEADTPPGQVPASQVGT